MTSTIYLLRHGQTEFNAERRLQGHCDSPLTALGEEQAQAMGAALRDELGDELRNGHDYAVLVSPLGRAQQTARLVCQQLGIPTQRIQTDQRLIEVSFGNWEKLNVLELHAEQPQLAKLDNWYFEAPNGEAYTDVVARIEHFLADPQLPNKMIIVAHGLLGRIFRGVYANMSAATMWSQDMPQDAFFKLRAGKIKRIECRLPA
ncbi:phosphoglycerate mutase family protein [Chitinibacter sp. SCUT-21]|uniref:histidine phosphatase family protein n=1 Tax=Chitinibacter sp. SCUT-21 TaxID=2970891 RepID=UPI0035A73406